MFKFQYLQIQAYIYRKFFQSIEFFFQSRSEFLSKYNTIYFFGGWKEHFGNFSNTRNRLFSTTFLDLLRKIKLRFMVLWQSWSQYVSSHHVFKGRRIKEGGGSTVCWIEVKEADEIYFNIIKYNFFNYVSNSPINSQFFWDWCNGNPNQIRHRLA